MVWSSSSERCSLDLGTINETFLRTRRTEVNVQPWHILGGCPSPTMNSVQDSLGTKPLTQCTILVLMEKSPWDLIELLMKSAMSFFFTVPPILTIMKKCFSHQTFSIRMCLSSIFTGSLSLLVESFTLEIQPLPGSKAQCHQGLASDLS